MTNLVKLVFLRMKIDKLKKQTAFYRHQVYMVAPQGLVYFSANMPEMEKQRNLFAQRRITHSLKKLKESYEEMNEVYRQFNELKQTNTFKFLTHVGKYGSFYIVALMLMIATVMFLPKVFFN